MKMDVIKWDAGMAVRCLERVDRESQPRTEVKKSQINDAFGIAGSAAFPYEETKTDEHWEDFKKAMDKIMNG